MRPDTKLLLQMCVGVWVCISNSAIFIFGILSPHLRSAPFTFSSADVNVIATVGAVASYISLPVGMLYDRCGPRAVLFSGAVANLIGWLGIALIFWSVVATKIETISDAPPTTTLHQTTSSATTGNTSTLSPNHYSVALHLSPIMEWLPPFYWICLFYGISQFSSPFYEQGAVLTNLQALSTHKGDVVLIQKTFMGLGSSIISQVYAVYYLGSSSSTGGTDSSAAFGTSGNETREQVEDYISDKHSMASFCILIAAFSAMAGVVGGIFSKLPVLLGFRTDSIVVEERNNLQRQISDMCRTVSRILSTQRCARVVGLNNLPERQKTTIIADKSLTPIRESEVNAETDATTRMNEELQEAKQTEMAVASVLYGPFFFVTRTLTFTLIGLVSIVTFVSSVLSPSDESFRFQQVAVTIVIVLCTIGFFVLLLLFNPKRSYQELVSDKPETIGDVNEPAPENSAGLSGLHHRRQSSSVSNGSSSSHKSKTKEHTRSGAKYDKISELNSSNVASSTSSSSLDQPCCNVSTLECNTRSLLENLLHDPDHLFALLAFRSLVVMGVTTTISSNSSQIYYALDPSGYTDASNAAIVSAFGVANALGRVAVGLIDRAMQAALHDGGSEEEGDKIKNTTILVTESVAHDWVPWMFKWFKLGSYGQQSAQIHSRESSVAKGEGCSSRWTKVISRPIGNVILSLVSGGQTHARGWNVLHVSLIPHIALLVAFPLFFVIPSTFLIVPFALVGFAAGTLWGGLVLVVSYMYNPAHHGSHYGALSFAGMMTPIVFNVVLFGLTYDNVLRDRGLPLSTRCAGLQCVQQPLLWCLGVNVLGTLAALLLCRRACRKGSM